MRELVHLNIYDMTSLNQYISPIGVGVYHSAVQIYEKEYGYGGHSFPVSGVFEIQPKDEIALGEESFKFKETIIIGQTDFNKDEVREIINNLGSEFRGDQYHLLHKNCNHFSDKLTRILCGKGIPNWINRLASVIVSVPLLERIIGKEYLTPIQLDNNLCSVIETESRNQIEDDKPGQIKLFNRKKL